MRGGAALIRAQALHDLLCCTLARPGEAWKLLLSFWATEDEMEDWSMLSQSLPWLSELGRGRNVVCTDLRAHSFALVLCEAEAEARRLFDSIRGTRVAAMVFARDGAEVSWPRSEAAPLRPSPGRTGCVLRNAASSETAAWAGTGERLP